jgi:hypothetical protein
MAATAVSFEDGATDTAVAGVGQQPSKGRSAGQATKKKSSGKNNITYCWKHHQFGTKAYNCVDPATCM